MSPEPWLGFSSGKLEGAELLELAGWVWRSFNPEKDPDAEQIAAEADKILSRIDKNGDRVVDFEEFCVYYAKTAESIARFHKKKALQKRLRKKGSASNSVSQNDLGRQSDWSAQRAGSRSNSRAGSRHTTPSTTPLLQAKVQSISPWVSETHIREL